jgi:glycosyltransferase involved in cell wall biosynthesis
MMIKIASEMDCPAIVEGSAKPRVLVVGPGPSQIGGVATFLGILLSSERLREKFELIHLDTARGKHGAGVEGRFALINIIYFARQIVQFLQISLREKPQIVHLPINFSWAFWKEAAFILLARIMRMKVVAHLHEGVFDQYYLKSSSFNRRLIRWVMCRANVVVALSNSWKDFLLKEVSPDLNIEVVPNTVSPKFASAINNTKTASSEKIVLFVGGLGHKKGVFDILKAVPIVVSRIRDTQFLFAGNPENKSVGEEIERLCVEGKLNESVKFLGVITGQEKIDLFQEATIFVLPSYADNFPYALLEAMSSGLPVITTPVGAIPEIVEDGKNGFLIEPGDYKALADRIIRLLSDSTLRHEMALANTTLVQNDYLPESAFNRFDQIYSSLVLTRR